MSRDPARTKPPLRLVEKLRVMPDAPGVYLYKDRRGKVIYVGKAKRLSQRVRSYFQNSGERDPKTDQLIRRIQDVDTIATDSETAALVLESQLIKEYRPAYNIQLKDDKQYPYIRVTLQEPFPRVMVVRRMARDGARYFGPYTDVRAMRETLKFACGLFQVRTCHLDLPDPAVQRPCLDYQIGRCSAPCVGLDEAAAYRRRVRQLILFLEGADRRLLQSLRRQMATLSRELAYEEAGRVRDRLDKLERTISRSHPVPHLAADLDVCGLVRDGRQACGVILRVRRGKILTIHHYILSDRLERPAADFQAQLLREYYPRAGDVPPEVLLAQDLDDQAAWSEWLSTLRGGAVRLHRPRRGGRRAAVQMAQANAALRLRQERAHQPDRRDGDKRIAPGDIQLQEALGLHSVPETIECFDISSFQGREAVGSLVYFRRGLPLKSRYRRFRIREVTGSNDFAMLQEVLGRYYGRLAGRNEPPADLVVVDGGAGQVSAAREVLTRFGHHATELLGLAKREELIYRERGEPPLRLPRSSAALQLLQRVRDEAHRFAISYHRLLRDQRTTASALDGIPGIGRVKKLALLHHFGTVEAIREATAAQLCEVRGLNQRDVERLLAYWAGQKARP